MNVVRQTTFGKALVLDTCWPIVCFPDWDEISEWQA
jgi:hypothetical protein